MINQVQRQFGFVMPIKINSIGIDTESSSDLGNWFECCLAGNFNIRSHRELHQEGKLGGKS